MSFSFKGMEEKLAQFRAKKQAEKAAEDRKDKVKHWAKSMLGFGPASQNDHDDNQETLENNSWTFVDVTILVVKLCMWLVGQLAFVHLGFGAVYFATSAFACIWLNLGTKRRRPGEMSAYSVFNPGCKSIQGTLTADQFEAEIRHKRL